MKTIIITKKAWRNLRDACSHDGLCHVSTESLCKVDGISSRMAHNMIPTLRALGLIDGHGQLTPLGKRWSSDDGYAEACREIVDSCFPILTVRELETYGKTDTSRIVSDYAKADGCGLSVATKNLYFLKFLLRESNQARPLDTNRHDEEHHAGEEMEVTIRVPRERIRDVVDAIVSAKITAFTIDLADKTRKMERA